MKRIMLFFIAWVVFISTAMSQISPTVGLTTSLSAGSTFTFVVTAGNNPAMITIKVDFGDGYFLSKTVMPYSSATITGTLGSSRAVSICNGADLTELYCPNQGITGIEFYNYPNFTLVNCSNNQLTSLNVSQLASLKKLACNNNQLSQINMGTIAFLDSLDCSYNNLTSLDISAYSTLTKLNCNYNRLTSLKVNTNTNLKLSCTNNRFGFNNLPVGTFALYTYAPQAPMSIINSTALYDAMDLSSQALVQGFSTVYKLKTSIGITLTEGTDYSITSGKIVFLKIPADSVYCEMTNTKYPAFTGANVLRTTNVKVKQAPVITMVSANAVGSEFTFIIGTNALNALIMIDYGDGTLVPFTVSYTSNELNYIGGYTLVGSQIVKVYGTGIRYLSCLSQKLTSLNISEDTTLTYLNCGGNQLTALDVSKHKALKELNCANNQLTTINLNNNVALQKLNCATNQITSLDLSKQIALTELQCWTNKLSILNISKNTDMSDVNCSENQLSALDLSNNTKIKSLNCMYNKITSLDVSKDTALTYFSCYNNNLTSLNVNNKNKLKNLDCSNNYITSLNLDNDTALIRVNCYKNNLTFTTLPVKQTNWIDYNTVPQVPISISKSIGIGGQIDLSSQYSVNGNITSYKWKVKGFGSVLTEGTDYTITNGRTVFLKAQSDSVYCEMTNATHPTFVGSYALTTTNVKILSGSSPTGVDKVIDNGPCIYPNPVSNSLFIKNSAGDKLQIYDVRGRKVMVKEMYNSIENIDISALPEGLYIVRIGNQQIKLVKQ
jgi:Leucine-rich repeat (LRR) protein